MELFSRHRYDVNDVLIGHGRYAGMFSGLRKNEGELRIEAEPRQRNPADDVHSVEQDP